MKPLNFQVQGDGTLTPFSRQLCANVIAGFAGKWIQIVFSERKEKRSLDQNAYYWSAIVPHVRKVRMEMGDPLSMDQVHEDLLAQFAPNVSAKRLDEKPYGRSMRSKEMSVKEMSDYVTAITGFMAAFGHPVPIKEEAA
jgi:hypothetical protein